MCDTLEVPEDTATPQCSDHLQSIDGFLLSTAPVVVLAIVYMAISTGLITFNKYLVHESRFPYVIFIGAMHMCFSLVFNALLYRACPSLYPALSDPEAQVEIDWTVLRVLLPIGGCFGAQLVLSNLAYIHSSLAFLQMMKQSNVVLVYVFSLALSLEHFSWKRILVLLCIIGSTGLTVHGELNFSTSGFTMQAVSMLCESMKLTLQSYSLSAEGKRLDALTFVMLVAPLVILVLAGLHLALWLLWPSRPLALTLPPWPALAEYWQLLLANGCLSFAMNVSHALFIKMSSATTFILTGVIMKDVVIVVVSAFLLGELLSPMQVAGFTMQLVAILVWSLLKAAPKLPMGPNGRSLKSAEDCEALQCDNNKPALLEAELIDAKSGWREANVALTKAARARRPPSPTSKGSCTSTVAPFPDEESCAEGASPCVGML